MEGWWWVSLIKDEGEEEGREKSRERKTKRRRITFGHIDKAEWKQAGGLEEHIVDFELNAEEQIWFRWKERRGKGVPF